MSINYTADDDMKRIQALDIARESGKVDLTGIERDRELMRQPLEEPVKQSVAQVYYRVESRARGPGGGWPWTPRGWTNHHRQLVEAEKEMGRLAALDNSVDWRVVETSERVVTERVEEGGE